MQGHFGMFFVEPDCSWVWSVWVVWEHEKPGKAPDHGDDGVDDEKPSNMHFVSCCFFLNSLMQKEM